MKNQLIQPRFVVALLFLGWMARDIQAAVTFLGPSPYLSRADSPFPVDGSNPNSFLEDFEDGELNTPGIYQPLHHIFGTAFHGAVMGPSELTDSVDADDVVIDGSGTAGHSFRSGALFFGQTIPQMNTVEVRFEFDSAELGYLPDVFGFVWTDGPVGINYFREALDLRVIINHSSTNEYRSPYVKLHPSENRSGSTAEDRFFGFVSDAPITNVTIFGVYYGDTETMPYFEIDHVQYGRLQVPEPANLLLLTELLIALTTWRRCRGLVAIHNFCS